MKNDKFYQSSTTHHTVTHIANQRDIELAILKKLKELVDYYKFVGEYGDVLVPVSVIDSMIKELEK